MMTEWAWTVPPSRVCRVKAAREIAPENLIVDDLRPEALAAAGEDIISGPCTPWGKPGVVLDFRRQHELAAGEDGAGLGDADVADG